MHPILQFKKYIKKCSGLGFRNPKKGGYEVGVGFKGGG
jgi:hypothetical protein